MQAPSPEIWSETICGGEEVLAGKWGGLFMGYLLGGNYRRRDRDHLTPPRRMDAAVCRAEVCYPFGRKHGRHRAVKRRDFITLLGGAAAWPLAARAQTKRARIGWFTVAPHPYIDGLRRGLRELGWIEGENLVIEDTYADGHPERLPGLAAVLARVPYDLIVASGSDAVEAARAAIQSIPIVGISSTLGMGGSLAHSEGNLTGIALLFDEVANKWLELLVEAVPHAQRIGAVFDPSPSETRKVGAAVADRQRRYDP